MAKLKDRLRAAVATLLELGREIDPRALDALLSGVVPDRALPAQLSARIADRHGLRVRPSSARLLPTRARLDGALGRARVLIELSPPGRLDEDDWARLDLAEPLAASFDLFSDNTLADMATISAPRVTVGHEAFEARYSVRSPRPELLASILDESVRQVLLDVPVDLACSAHERRVRLTWHARETSERTVDALIEVLRALAGVAPQGVEGPYR